MLKEYGGGHQTPVGLGCVSSVASHPAISVCLVGEYRKGNNSDPCFPIKHKGLGSSLPPPLLQGWRTQFLVSDSLPTCIVPKLCRRKTEPVENDLETPLNFPNTAAVSAENSAGAFDLWRNAFCL